MLLVTEKILKWILIVSSLVLMGSYFYKDNLPEPEHYDLSNLKAPLQTTTIRPPFITQVNEQTYRIVPKYDYELYGVIVSYHDADEITDIYRHELWKDYINLRDLCVIWGENVSSGVYKKMDFKNTTWTCWASWPDRETGRQFGMHKLSNNHLLSDSELVNKALLSAEPGDHIRLVGVLADYENSASGFFRKTSTSRNDTGNGACETVYVDEFSVIKKANTSIRTVYDVAWWLLVISLPSFILVFMFTPVRVR